MDADKEIDNQFNIKVITSPSEINNKMINTAEFKNLNKIINSNRKLSKSVIVSANSRSSSMWVPGNVGELGEMKLKY